MAAQSSGRAEPRAVQDSPSNISSKFTVAYRLLRTDGFDHVIHANNVADKHFKIYFIRNFKNNARIGIIASKQSIPRSADRNRVKRFVREAFRKHTIRHCKLDLVVRVSEDNPRNVDLQIDNLNNLFSQVESRCAK